MSELEPFGNMLIVTGGVLLLLGIILVAGGKIPFFGNLPGDISIEKGNFRFYAPIATFLIISIVLTILINLMTKG